MGQYEPMAVEGARWVVFDKYNDSTYHHLLKLKEDSAINAAILALLKNLFEKK